MAFRWTALPPPAESRSRALPLELLAASRPKVASPQEALLPVPALTRREAWPLAPEPALRREALPLELESTVSPLRVQEKAVSQPRALPLAQALSLPAAWLRQAPAE
jgi:hypothetical protein